MGFLDFFTGDQPPLIKGALDDVSLMLNVGRDTFAAAAAHLLDNEILEMDLAAQSAEIGAREQSARRAVLEHLNLDPKRELVLCIKIVTVAHEAGHIGGLCMLMGRAAQLAHKPRLGRMVNRLREIRTQTLELFDDARDSFLDGDQTRARSLFARHMSVKSSLAGYIHELAEMKGGANEAMVYTMATHAMANTGMHLANIAGVVTAPFIAGPTAESG